MPIFLLDDLLNVIFYSKIKCCSMSTKSSLKTCLKFFALNNLCVLTQNLWKCPKIFSWDSPALKWSPSLNVSTTPITANVYLLVLFSWKVNIGKNSIAVRWL